MLVRDGDTVQISTALTQVEVHSSHSQVVECGGYVGCLCCLLYTKGNRNKSKLIGACRGRDATPNFKGRSDVSNLTKGKFPPNTLHTWPSGERNPIPRIYDLTNEEEPPTNNNWRADPSSNTGTDPGDSDFFTNDFLAQLNEPRLGTR